MLLHYNYVSRELHAHYRWLLRALAGIRLCAQGKSHVQLGTSLGMARMRTWPLQGLTIVYIKFLKKDWYACQTRLKFLRKDVFTKSTHFRYSVPSLFLIQVNARGNSDWKVTTWYIVCSVMSRDVVTISSNNKQSYIIYSNHILYYYCLYHHDCSFQKFPL